MKKVDVEERVNLAMNNFTEGYNCAQAVALAFADLTNIPADELTRLASSFGGGMGRLREVCGAVSAMFMIVGLLYGYDTPSDGPDKAKHYARIQELAELFENEHDSIVCRELRGLSVKRESFIPEKRTKKYYEERPCKNLVGTAAQILACYINEQA